MVTVGRRWGAGHNKTVCNCLNVRLTEFASAEWALNNGAPVFHPCGVYRRHSGRTAYRGIQFIEPLCKL